MSFKKFYERQDRITSPIANALRETRDKAQAILNELAYGEIPKPTSDLTKAIKDTHARSKTIEGLADIKMAESKISFWVKLKNKVKNIFKK